MYTPEFIERMKQQLSVEKAKLETGLKGTKAFPEYDTQSQDDVAEKIEADAVSQDEVVQMQAELDKVNAALERIANGTYGKSLATGEYISEERLEAFPAAEDSI